MIVRAAHEFFVRRFSRERTYGQFGEDAMLLSRMAEVAYLNGEAQPKGGFYVDVGAFKPVSWSNTYALYRRGWRGITIEPSPGSAPMFRLVRPRDVFVEQAVGSADGTVPFYTWGTPVVINTADPEHAARFEARLGKAPSLVHVPMRTLGAILHEHLPSGQRIDVLSVDVEGLTMDVLRGNDWEMYAPRWVVIEVDVRPVPGAMLDPAIDFLRERGYEVVGFGGPSVLMEKAGW